MPAEDLLSLSVLHCKNELQSFEALEKKKSVQNLYPGSAPGSPFTQGCPCLHGRTEGGYSRLMAVLSPVSV